jgi:hypothetical protein
MRSEIPDISLILFNESFRNSFGIVPGRQVQILVKFGKDLVKFGLGKLENEADLGATRLSGRVHQIVRCWALSRPPPPDLLVGPTGQSGATGQFGPWHRTVRCGQGELLFFGVSAPVCFASSSFECPHLWPILFACWT